MSAQRLDITVYDNDTLSLLLSLKSGVALTPADAENLPPLPLAGFHALLQTRTPTAGDLLSEISTPGLSGHSGQGITIVDDANGQIRLTFSADFATPELVALKIVDYDLILIDSLGEPHRVMYGKLTARKGVARP